MTSQSLPSSYMGRAESTLSEARILIQAAAVRGACNRACYAMFHAAHAALFALGIEGLNSPIKTHNGLVARFGQEIILPGHLPRDLGHVLSRASDFRLLADYSDDTITLADAASTVERAEAFVAAVKRKFQL